MKKITLAAVSVLTVLAMVFCLAACGQTPEQKLNADKTEITTIEFGTSK